MLSTLPLTWPALEAHCRSPFAPYWRGLMPAVWGRPQHLAPLPIAICGQFSKRPSFTSEAEAELFRSLSPRAMNVTNRWSMLRYEREAVSAAIADVRGWQEAGDERQAAMAMTGVRIALTQYRKNMRRLSTQLAAIRRQLTPARRL